MMVSWNACPMCRLPVTFGGGIIIAKDWPSPEGRKWPAFSQVWYQACSMLSGW